MFLSRSMYSALVTHYPLLMRDLWPMTRRSWTITGVTVSDPPSWLTVSVRSLIESAR